MKFSPHHITKDFIVFWWRLLMLEIDILFNLSIKDCMFITSKTGSSEGCSVADFDSNWAYSRAWGIFTIGVGWSSTSFPSIGLSFKSKREWISLSHVKFSNSAMLYSASIVSSHANCKYSSMGISTLRRFKKEWDFLIHLLLLSLSISHVHHSWQNQHSCM